VNHPVILDDDDQGYQDRNQDAQWHGDLKRHHDRQERHGDQRFSETECRAHQRRHEYDRDDSEQHV